jgi:hypothetical protein
MALKLTVFTTLTNPTIRGDNWRDALECYKELADELIIINGGEDIGLRWYNRPARKQLGMINSPWPREFNWPLIGEQFQKAYEIASGDWVIHADLDMIFHEEDFKGIRQAMEAYPNQPGLSFWKYQFILPDRYNLKSRVILAVNKKKYGNRIRFDSGGDLCQPSLDGEHIPSAAVAESRIAFYNYEKMTKTADQMMDDCGRMDRAYHRYFKDWQLSVDGSGSDESCFDGYIRMLKGRFAKEQRHIKLNEHPKFVQETILKLRKDQFGFNGFGLFGDSDYVKEEIHA